jgi:hypothetical protein
MTAQEAIFPYSQAHVTNVTTLRRTQRLPHGAIPKVAIGQMVKAMEIVAVAEVPQERRLIDLSKLLRVSLEGAADYILKREGDLVRAGEVLASRSVLLGIRKRRALSPVEGRIAWIGDGQILVEGGHRRVEIPASAPGRVTAIEPGEYVTIESHGAAIEMAWGGGGLAWGTLKLMDTAPSPTPEPGRFNIDHRGAIVAIASSLTEPFFRDALDIRVKGLIAASASASMLPLLERSPFPVGLTQGFGQLPMSDRVLNLLSTHNGREIALAMSVPGDDSRETPPEIIIPSMSGAKPEDKPSDRPEQHAIRPGDRVRVLQNPYRGEIGTVAAIADRPHQLASGLWVSGVQVEFSPGRTVFVAVANLQYLG